MIIVNPRATDISFVIPVPLLVVVAALGATKVLEELIVNATLAFDTVVVVDMVEALLTLPLLVPVVVGMVVAPLALPLLVCVVVVDLVVALLALLLLVSVVEDIDVVAAPGVIVVKTPPPVADGAEALATP